MINSLPSLKKLYELQYAEAFRSTSSKIPNLVAIIGGGITGLYSALLLKNANIPFHIFEASASRLGGRIFTHKFSDEKNQYFDTGAMRFPNATVHRPFFNLINYVNERVSVENRVELEDYILYHDYNYVFVNGVKKADGTMLTRKDVDANPAVLNFTTLDPQDRNKTAKELLMEAIKPFIDLLTTDFVKGFREIIKYDDHSMRSYLRQIACWDEAKIDYVETLTSQDNQFVHSFAEIVMEYIEFSNVKWKHIVGGSSRLIDACIKIIGMENISIGTKVTRIEETLDNKVILYSGTQELGAFNKAIAAIPPTALRMMKTPLWPIDKERAIRTLNFEALYKLGMQFKTRFWENETITHGHPSRGGVTITDRPSVWICYPSYGINDTGPGVLMTYVWTTNGLKWLTLPQLWISIMPKPQFY